ncbi:UNVERIFIED_CONTAM: spore coat protein F [Acetivibrio alkalicellulosi]
MAILENIFGTNLANKPTDETFAYTLMAGAAASAISYLTATLDSTTPDVRRMLNAYTNEIIKEHEALATLSVSKGWFKPYESPIEQLQISVEHSKSMIQPK